MGSKDEKRGGVQGKGEEPKGERSLLVFLILFLWVVASWERPLRAAHLVLDPRPRHPESKSWTG